VKKRWKDKSDRCAGETANDSEELVKFVPNWQRDHTSESDQNGSVKVFATLSFLWLGPSFVKIALNDYVGGVYDKWVRHNQVEAEQNLDHPHDRACLIDVVGD
jgi:hypothetical protein